MTLAEKGAEADFFLVDLFEAEHRNAAHLARHPFGVVPVLDDDGFVLYESRAIIRYLDARLSGPSLVPAVPHEAARMNQWLSVDQSYVAPHTRTLAIERILKKHQGIAPNAEAIDMAEKALRHALVVFDRALDGNDYLAGRTFSLADISLLPYLASLPSIGAEHLTRDLTHLAAWSRTVRERASWTRATSPS
jgi:glutathione S-transferase